MVKEEELMKKKLYSVIAFAAVLVVLIGVYAFVVKKSTKKSSSSSTGKDVLIANCNTNKLSKINISSKNSSLEFVYKDKRWDMPAYTFKIDETSIESMANDMCKFKASRKIESNVSDLSKYGLDKPKGTIKLTFTDGTQKEYLLGNSAVGGSYYVIVNGEKTVYTISEAKGNYFLSTISDYGDKTILTFTSGSISYLKVEKQAGKTIEIQKNANQTDTEKQYQVHAWKCLQPYSTSVGGDDSSMSTLLTEVDKFVIKSLIDCNPSDLSKYGLDKPKVDLTMKDTSNNKLELLFGNDKDSGETYFKTSSSNRVYTISKSIVDYFAGIKPFDFTAKYIFEPNLDTVDQIIISGKDRNDTITITKGTANKSSSKTSDSTEDTNVYKINDKKVDSKKFSEFYQGIIALDADAENDKTPGDSSDIKIEFKLNSGTDKDVVVKYVPYNEDFYSAVVNGKCDFVIAKNKIDTILTKLDALKK